MTFRTIRVVGFAAMVLVPATAVAQSGTSAIGRVTLEIRAEAYNRLNRVNLNVPGSTLGAADFGVVSSARAPRTLQLGGRLTF